MLGDYAAHDPVNGGPYALAVGDDFDGYVESLLADESREGLPSEYAPCSHRWLVDNPGEIVGIVRVRHDGGRGDPEEEVGHIGYDVPPSQRGRGYGVQSLRAGLQVAGGIGLEGVIVLAETRNVPSWRTIERCGGVIEGSFFSEHHQGLVRRYRIRAGAPGDPE